MISRDAASREGGKHTKTSSLETDRNRVTDSEYQNNEEKG